MNLLRRVKKNDDLNRDGRAFAWLAIIATLFVGCMLVAIAVSRFGRESSGPPTLPANIEGLDRSVAELIRAHYRIGQTREWDAQAFGELGLVYEANQLWQNAYDVFRQAVQLNPRHRGWRLHLAICAHQIGNFEVEQAEIQSLVASAPEFLPALQRYGQALMDSGKLADAATTFTRVIDLDPSLAEGYVGLAEVHLRQGKPDAAVPLLERAVQVDDGYQVAHFLLGSAYRELGREQEAASHTRKGVGGTIRYLPDALSIRMEKYAVNLKAQTTAAVKQIVAGQTEPAGEALEKVLQAEPDNVTAMNNLAGSYVQQNRIEDAEALLQRALTLGPNTYATHVNLANIAVLKKQFDKALAHTTRAVELNPNVVLTHRSRASVLFRMGRFQEAYDSAAAAARLNPGDIGAQLQCADLALRLDNFELAIRHFDHVLEENPNHVDALIGLVRAHWAMGQHNPARKALAQVATLAPDDRRVKILLEKISPK